MTMNEKPTKVRYWVLFVVCLVYLITYLDRVNISVAGPLMMKEFNLNKLEWGLVLSVFSWTYATCQIPVGILSDRVGARPVLAGIVAFWSLMTALTAQAWSYVSLVVIRLMFGAGEAGAFPTATRAFSHWIPPTERGFVQGLTHGCSRLGGALAPAVVAIIMARWGWRWAFYSFAIIGFIWAAFWYFWYRDTPAEFRAKWGGINQAEIDLINSGKSNKPKVKLPFATLLRSRNLWFLSLSYPTYCYTIWIFMTWLPAYLVEARGFSIIKMGIFASLPLLAGTVGDTLGGWLSDRIWRHTKNGKFSRRVVAMSGMLVAAAFMIPGALTNSSYMAVFYMACSLFGLEMAVGVYWAVCLDVGHQYAGTVSGLMNTMGNVGSAASPLVFGAILQFTGSWVYPFIVASSLLVIGAILWLKVNPEMSIAEELSLEPVVQK
ncbi:MAG: MFS transporter [Opitutaceae bacterium]|nr:MFS transporter [Opitutaceae bacterium]